MHNRSLRNLGACGALALALALTGGPVFASHHHHSDDDSSSSSSSKSSEAKAKPAPAPAPAATSPAPAPAPAPTPAAAPANEIPDYGGRDTLMSASANAAGADAPSSPLTQAWRSFQALVVVLALTIGGLFVAKKYGLIKEGTFAAVASAKKPAGPMGFVFSGVQGLMKAVSTSGTPARPVNVDPTTALNLLSSTPLPGPAPASVHLIEVAGRRFLVGASGSGMTLLSDWDSEPAVVDVAEPEIAGEEERFEAYLNRMGMTAQSPPDVVGERVSQAAGRLEAMLARAREDAGE